MFGSLIPVRFQLNFIQGLINSFLATNTWSSPVVSGSKPSKRRYHAAELIHNYLVVFGGGDDKNFYNDTHILNLGMYYTYLCSS
jgi:hypothetical protein